MAKTSKREFLSMIATAKKEKQKQAFHAVHIPLEDKPALDRLMVTVSNELGVPVSAGRCVVLAMEEYIKRRTKP